MQGANIVDNIVGRILQRSGRQQCWQGAVLPALRPQLESAAGNPHGGNSECTVRCGAQRAVPGGRPNKRTSTKRFRT